MPNSFSFAGVSSLEESVATDREESFLKTNVAVPVAIVGWAP